MPLQVSNFSQMIQPHDYSGISDALKNYYQGYQLAATPEKMEQERISQDILNRMHGAQTQHYQDQAAGRTFAPSALGKLIQERNDIEARNPNDPMLAEYDRVIKSTGGSRFAPSGLGKLYTERQQVEEGYLPGSSGSIPLNSQEQQELLNRYDLQIQKHTTDSATRTTVLRGQNLLKSIDASNIDALTRYSGPKGALNLKMEQAKDLAGNPSKKYLQHLEAMQAVQLEAKELRQFFGDSITPEIQDAIYKMVNATSLTKSPEAAKRMIEKSRDTIRKQVKTFSGALKSIEAYDYPDASKTEYQRQIDKHSADLFDAFNQNELSLQQMTDEEIMEALKNAK